MKSNKMRFLNNRSVVVFGAVVVLLLVTIGIFNDFKPTQSVNVENNYTLDTLPSGELYIIGRHLFTEDSSYLTSQGIMTASRTIAVPGNISQKEIYDYMKIYARDLEGNWIDASTGEIVDSSVINVSSLKYQNLEEISYSLYNEVFSGASLDTNVDFGTTPVAGKYILSETKDDKNPVTYYRGAVTNNNLVFGGFCWKIVRTTETGGTKLVYNGKAVNNKCDSTGDPYISNSTLFNSSYESPADFSYVYDKTKRYEVTYNWPTGTSKSTSYVYANDVTWDGEKYVLSDTQASGAWSTSSNRTKFANGYHYTCFTTDGTCGNTVYYINYFGSSSYPYYLTFTNGVKLETAMSEMFTLPDAVKDANYTTTDYDSDIKKAIDTWYETNLKDYGKYLENTVWCNEKKFETGSLAGKDVNAGTGSSNTSAYNRLMNSPFQPTTKCSDNDSLYVGNGLKYPIALLTADEYTMAGTGSYSGSGYSYDSYLYDGQGMYGYWTMSPADFGNYYASGFSALAGLDNYYVTSYVAVRPSVSLASGTFVEAEGDGSASNPYVVITE